MEEQAAAPEKSRKALGWYTKETVLYDRLEAKHDGLPVVNFSYVPLTPNELQESTRKLEGASRNEALRLSVTIICRQLRQWDLQTEEGAVPDCRNNREIGAHMDNNLVEGICNRIMDSKSTAGVQEILANFQKR